MESNLITIVFKGGGVYRLHKHGCPNVHKEAETAEWVDHLNFKTLPEIIEDEYAGQLSDDPTATWIDYRDDFHVCPCLDLDVAVSK